MTDPVSIDGSLLEGGGQLLRVAVALSGVTGRPIRVENIRLKREKPGLRHQHLSAVKAVAELVDAQVTGLKVGSQNITFQPGRMVSKDYSVDVGTAGSTTLILQALMPALAFAPAQTRVTLTGGTNNPLAPSIDYMMHVLMPALRMAAYNCEVDLVRRGFYPKGDGHVIVDSKATDTLRPLQLIQPEEIRRVNIHSYSCRLPSHITQRMAKSASEIIQKTLRAETTTSIEVLQAEDPKCSPDPGCGLLLTLEHTSGLVAGFDGLGEQGKPAERVAEEVVYSAQHHLRAEAPVEPHLCDQLIVWMSLADGHSQVRTSALTLHALTCIEVARQVLGVKFEVEGKLGEAATISCDGVGLRNTALKGSMQGVI